MSDDKEKTGAQDRNKINVSEDYEVQYWSKKFSITPAELRKAIENAGSNNSDKVQLFLDKRKQMANLKIGQQVVQEFGSQVMEVIGFDDNLIENVLTQWDDEFGNKVTGKFMESQLEFPH